uniref:Uncharacterized protein n=1 Tax=Oryza rufipogon TaxID=4529 RepID=A0A0E0P075_ORYRU
MTATTGVRSSSSASLPLAPPSPLAATPPPPPLLVAPPLSLMPSFPPPPFSWPGVARRCPRGESFLRIFTHRFRVAQGAEERGLG